MVEDARKQPGDSTAYSAIGLLGNTRRTSANPEKLTCTKSKSVHQRADERTRTADLLIMSERSGVAGVCTRLQIPYI